MKLLILGSQLTSLVNFRGPLIRDLVACGHEVIAVAPDPVEPWLGRLHDCGARYIESPLARSGMNPLQDISFLLWFWRVLRAERPDVLFAFHAKPVIYGMLAGWLAGIKRRIAMIEGLGQGFAVERAGWKRRILGQILPLLYRIGLACTHTVFFLNSDDEDEFRAWGIIHKQQVVRIPGIGVDLAHFTAHSLPAGPVTFLMIARLLIDKGVRDYAAAAAILKRSRPDWRFCLLGPYDPTPAGVKPEEVAGWQAIDYLGETSDVRPYLAACHVFVLPTFYREGVPRSILEAMATGRAILTTQAPGARETVVAGLNGYLVDSRNPQALAEAMGLIATDESALASMGQASRRLAEDKYEVSRINRQIITVLTGEKCSKRSD